MRIGGVILCFEGVLERKEVNMANLLAFGQDEKALAAGRVASYLPETACLILKGVTPNTLSLAGAPEPWRVTSQGLSWRLINKSQK